MAGGAPTGNTNSATGKQGRRALEMALDSYNTGKPVEAIARIQTMVKMWEPIIKNAMEKGDLAALKEINDRLDGRAAQQITVDAKIELGLDGLSDTELDSELRQAKQAQKQSTQD